MQWVEARRASGLRVGLRGGVLAGLAVLLSGGMPALAAQPRVPQLDSEVVEVLRERPLSAQEKAWRALRAQARARPTDVALATQVAWQALRWARQDGDPRWLGQAQAALTPWWSQPAPPDEVRLLRATILQSTHDFDAALRDLRALVRARPDQPQAWLTLASVLQVTGQYDEAQSACNALKPAGAPWHAQACALELHSQRGEAGAADAAQRGLAELVTRAPRELSGYLNLIRAELAQRQGQPDKAAALYQAVLAAEDDAYTQGAYADLLLDQGRAAEVVSLLKGHERNDALLLRLAQAYAVTGDAALDRSVQALRARFAAAHERGDSVHRREEARFTLHLLKRPQEALRLAQLNWQVQKEPADARILLEAAQAAGEPQAADAVRAFMRRWGWSDKRLEAWL
ncbi:MAG: tetratricopeptide repeat protein [Aquabacterium sp.]|uniref:tetratricopeptide repeat protein n=1 Tax=Aquabacterium sp. TaxID=1872578 RepID=UPI0025C6C1FF|nr:tetratricopeptide repeat protein [Aquabacterium sp.]MBI3382097.1 tetratricopeptide repeat protein [Aquabacterium sp.]